jgi:hypothetical protein
MSDNAAEPLIPLSDNAVEPLIPLSDNAVEPLVPLSDNAAEPLIPKTDNAAEPHNRPTLAGVTALTVAVNVTACPTVEGLGELVSVMALVAVPTLKLAVFVLVTKSLSPE